MKALMNIGLSCWLFAQLSLGGYAQSGIITTYAGPRLPENGTQATTQAFELPGDVVLDGAGGFYFVSSTQNRVYRVAADGQLAFVAGNGIPDFNGDGGQATAAALNGPGGIAVDSSGNLFIADAGNYRIRKVTPAGIISTIAGTGSSGYGGDGGLATAAQLYRPGDIALDSANNLYISDGNRIRKVTAAGVISTVAGSGDKGFSGDDGPATAAQLNYTGSVAVDSNGNLFIADYVNHRIRKVGEPRSSIRLTANAGGGTASSTAGSMGGGSTGYSAIDVRSGTAPYGTAVFSYKQNGVTVSEAGVPASPPTTAARVFIDYRSRIAALPGRPGAGAIDVNTGVAVVNEGSATGHITYTLRGIDGTILATGLGTVAARSHYARFIDQFNQIAQGFNLPANFRTDIQFASLDILSDQPLSVLALRMTTNQRNEVLFTTTPTADLMQPTDSSITYFAQLADGGGYTTSIVLLNTSNAFEAGTLQLLDDEGNAYVVSESGGTSGSSFRYAIPPGGFVRFQTVGSQADTRVGWARLTPDAGSSTPVGAGLFGYNPGNYLITESGIPAATSTTHARIYVDMSGGHGTGLALANLAGTSANMIIQAFQSDGVTSAGSSLGPLQIPANGHRSRFADQLLSGLPAGFTGLLDVVSATPFAAITIRALYNERGDFLVATFPIADMTRNAPAPIVFPQIADGGGYVTQFILIGASGASNLTLSFFDENGNLLPVGK